jgi:hypothetical protein
LPVIRPELRNLANFPLQFSVSALAITRLLTTPANDRRTEICFLATDLPSY